MGTSKHAKVRGCPSCNHSTSCKTLSELDPAGPEEASCHCEKACGKAPGQGTVVASRNREQPERKWDLSPTAAGRQILPECPALVKPQMRTQPT